jgi:hypothetical protein
MSTTSTHTPDLVLAAARKTASVITDAQIEQLLQAVEWAALYPGEEPDPTDWATHPIEIAGEGAPLVDESAVAEFALAIGMKHEPGVRLIGDAVELCHRLPRLWARVMAAEVPVWKARKIAQATRTLSQPAARVVDRHLALIAKKCSFAEIDRQVEKARSEHDPAEAERRRLAAADLRHFTVDRRQTSSEGLIRVEGWLDLADGLDLDDRITAKASTLDPSIPLDVRRSMAAGMLGSDAQGQRELVIYTHTRPDQTMVDVETTRTVITPEQVKEWCQQAGTRVTVRPVLDLAEERGTDGHDPTPLLREQIILRYRTCVFPECERLARSCDLDHRIPYPLGPTESWNLFPLCRKHHRLKTTGGWSYRPLDAHTIEWTSPLGNRYLRHID